MEAVTAANLQEFSTDLLRVYYDRLFPYDAMTNWLSYTGGPEFNVRREWSFTMEDDIYIRYQCFKDAKEMRAAMQKRQPHKIDIGAVFNAQPKDHLAIGEDFKTVERELVFDIDMTDYDDIRTCCTGANICHKCWPFMTMALKVTDEALREDFGFKHILWIYSGRRGIHCWVCDEQARALPNEARSAVVEYLSVHTAGGPSVGNAAASSASSSATPQKKSQKAVLKGGGAAIHPMIRRAYETLEPYFEKNICDGGAGQGLLQGKDKCVRIINTIPSSAVKLELLTMLDSSKEKVSGAERWRQIKASVTQSGESSNGNGSRKRGAVTNWSELEAWKIELVLTYCYPRLDVNVSKAQNHLLKSPFCVHPKTGRVCVPIDPTNADSFDPFAVPTLRKLCAQVDEYDKKHPGNTEDDVNKTSMKDAMQTFQATFMAALGAENRRVLRDTSERTAAMFGDF